MITATRGLEIAIDGVVPPLRLRIPLPGGDGWKPVWHTRLFPATILFILVLPSGLLASPSEEDVSAALRALEVRRDQAERCVANPSDANLELLARHIRNADRFDLYPVEERFAVKRELVEAMVSIPRHAEYLKNQIDEQRELWKSGKEQRYDSVRVNAIQTLGLLPSPEAVGVLGELLEDAEVPSDGPVDDPGELSPPPNSYWAAVGLQQLLTDGATTDAEGVDVLKARKSWVLWFEQVKAGTRTFRFKGDPQPYTLAGPAPKELRPAGGVGADRREPSRPAPPVAEREAAIDEAEESLSWLPLALAGGVLLAAVGFLLRARMR